ncbi:hypothetical protein LJK88_46465 [Paenibacillus sp. P26]|nr:hypothetical protein LJK88_46465 [Paenibacillus sp. P26]UUZ91966.1 hypothetical protein LJK87_41850 [Paenibacillus sp. P25]
MEKAIQLDVIHTLRQLGINPPNAMEFLTLEKVIFSDGDQCHENDEKELGIG